MTAKFKFKQFEIKQTNSAAKVGTDGVLLGAWSPIPSNCKHVLDIGTGTGLIALMIAQRTDCAIITAIEKDEISHLESQFNFNQSPWKNRFTAVQSALEDFVAPQKFDLIVSNPPFYTENTFNHNHRRFNARNTASLSFESLISKSSELLTQDGIFTVIIPHKEVDDFISLAKELGLFPFKILHVKGNESAPIKRSLIAFQSRPQDPEIQNLTIEKDRHIYTDTYQSLTKDFYLKM